VGSSKYAYFSFSLFAEDTLALTVHPSDYMGRLVDYCMVKIYALIRIEETNQTWSEEDDFILDKPKLVAEPLGRLQTGRLGRIKLSFVNPLDVELTNCRLTTEAPGTIREVREKLPDVGPKATFIHSVLVTPRKSGSTCLVASFSSEEMIDVHGSVKLDICC
jgi:hypothetical protein